MTPLGLVKGRDARSALPAPTLTIASGRQHTAATILKAWRESKSEHTIRGYEHDLADFAQWFSRALGISPTLSIEDALARFFRQSAPSAHEVMLFFRSHLLNDCGIAPATVNRHIAAMRSLSKLARQLGYCTWTLETQGVKLEKRRPTMGPTVEQVREMLAATGGDTEAETRDYAIVVTLFCCGLRVSELCGLNRSDVDLSHAQAWILGKGRREKVLIELPAAVVDAVRRYAKHRGTAAGPLFQTRGNRGNARDGRLETRSVLRIVRLAGQRIGIKTWCHALRHSSLTTAASEGAKAGFSLNDVRAHSRHASVVTLQGYLDQHNIAKTKRAIADLVAGALNEPPKST